MAKRIVQECDLTKQEYDPEETVTITFKHKGKTRGRAYDLSPAAAAKLEQQLVGGNKLPENWGFVPSSSPVRINLVDTEDTEGQYIDAKKAELRSAGVITEQTETKIPEAEVSEVTEVIGGRADCNHINKGRIQTTLRDGKRFIFRLCTECRGKVPETPKATRAAYLNGQVKDEDINIREL